MWQFGLREMLAAMAVVAVYFAALLLSIRGVSAADTKQLTIVSAAGFAGALVGIAINVWLQTRSMRTVFLLRRDPPGLVWCLGAIAPPIALLWASSIWETFTELSFVFRLGIVIGIAMTGCLAIWTLWQRSLALCQTGILVDRAFHTSWHRLRSAGWQIDESGRITFGQGWGRVSAQVPAEVRDAVEELVRAKFD